MTRRRVLCGLLLASALLACFAGWLWITRPRSMRERFEQVKEGMSRQEVMRMVGSPPDEYSTQQSVWVCEDAKLGVDFDDAGTAVNVVILPLPVRNPTLTQRIRRWLGL